MEAVQPLLIACYFDIMQLTSAFVWVPMVHKLTFLSSPPVTNTPELFCPILIQFTLPLCAGKSSMHGERECDRVMGRASQGPWALTELDVSRGLAGHVSSQQRYR